MTLIGETTRRKPRRRPYQGRLRRQLHGRRDRGFEDPTGHRRLLGPLVRSRAASWARPSRRLSLAAKGAVKLVKIDIDKNPAYAGQLRVQSIPAVFAFVDGQPVDGFMGALPASQVKRVRRPPGAKGHGADDDGGRWTSCWPWRRNRSSWATLGGAAQAYAQALQMRPGQRQGASAAWRGSTRQAATSSTPPKSWGWRRKARRTRTSTAVRAALALAAEAPSETAELEAEVTAILADADDHEALDRIRQGPGRPSGQLRRGGGPAARAMHPPRSRVERRGGPQAAADGLRGRRARCRMWRSRAAASYPSILFS
jgi:hypothetical protein